MTAPDWSIGSEWHYSDGYAVKVGSVSPKGAVFNRLDAPGQWFTRQGFIRTDSATDTATRNAIYRTVPDAAGASLSAAHPLTFQREYLNNGKLLVHASSWSVEGRETITVPAGTFDCWVIVWRTRSLRSDWTGFERWWYSPQAQNYVRMEFKYGPGPDGSRVLMKYNLAGSAPLAANPLSAAPASVAAPLPSHRPVIVPVALPKAMVVTAAPISTPAPVKQARVVDLTPPPALDKPRALQENLPAEHAPAAKPAPSAEAIEPKAMVVEAAPLPAPAPVPVREPEVAMLTPSVAKDELRALQDNLPAEHLLAAEPAPVKVETAAAQPIQEIPASAQTDVAAPASLPASAKEVTVAALAPVSEPPPSQQQAAVPAPSEPAKVKTAGSLPKGDKLGSWHAQLVAAQDASRVRDSLKKILARNPGTPALPSGVTVREVEGHTFYRAWLGSYDNADEARSLCQVLDLKKAYIAGCTVFKGATLEARAD